MKKKNIFTNKNITIVKLFDDAGDPKKVLCVPIDYAHKEHLALICNGSGRVLMDPFYVENSQEGIEVLLKNIRDVRLKHGIKKKHIFFGGEECGNFVLDFIYELRARGFEIIGVNAKVAARHRENSKASTDSIDLGGIATVLISKQGRAVGFPPTSERILRDGTRRRRHLIKEKTKISNHIHALISQIFPGFLNVKRSGIPAFSEASLSLMEGKFSPAYILRINTKTLIKQLKAKKMRKAEEGAITLKQLAAKIMKHSHEYHCFVDLELKSEIRLYRCLQKNISLIDIKLAKYFAKTPGAMLTTIDGIGITLAAGVAAEIGSYLGQNSKRSLPSYAGIVPNVKQTGGSESPPRTGRVTKHCNRILKNYLLQSSKHLGSQGPTELQEDFDRRVNSGQNADFGMARRYLRIGLQLMRTFKSYIPKELRRESDKNKLIEYYLELWPKVLKKWEEAGAHEEAFAADAPLGIWKKRVELTCEIKLNLSDE